MVLAHFQMAKHYENILKLFTEANVAIPFLSLFFLTDDCTCLRHSGLVGGNWSVGEGQQASTRHGCYSAGGSTAGITCPALEVRPWCSIIRVLCMCDWAGMSLWREEEQRFAKQLVVVEEARNRSISRRHANWWLGEASLFHRSRCQAAGFSQ